MRSFQFTVDLPDQISVIVPQDQLQSLIFKEVQTLLCDPAHASTRLVELYGQLKDGQKIKKQLDWFVKQHSDTRLSKLVATL